MLEQERLIEPLRAIYPRESVKINAALLAAAALFLLGIFGPMLTTSKFVIFQNRISLVSALIELLKASEYFLFVVIFTFSIFFPTMKLLALYQIWNSPSKGVLRRKARLHGLVTAGKWSMLDVFVVAVLVVSLKLRAIAHVEVHFAIYAFAGSVLLMMYATARTIKLAEAIAS